MATGRIGVTPVLRTRWSKLPTTGTTVLSGLDDNSVALVYDAGYEAVYRNGVLLSRGNDYTATNGTTITLIDATLAGDIIEVLANDLVPLTDAISKGQYNAKGALLSATAASTPAVLAVGSNDQVLTADSTTSTGLKWATAAAGGMTLLSTVTAAAATSVSFTSISGSYKHLLLVWERVYSSVTDTAYWTIRFNNNTAGNHSFTGSNNTSISDGTYAQDQFGNSANQAPILGCINTEDAVYNCFGAMWIYDYSDAARGTTVEWKSTAITNTAVQRISNCAGNYADATAITRIDFIRNSTQTVTGTFRLYGVS